MNWVENLLIFFFMALFQWFFMELSVRPFMCLAISDHLLPLNNRFKSIRKTLWYKYKIHSSSSSQGDLFIYGFKWLCHLKRWVIAWTFLYITFQFCLIKIMQLKSIFEVHMFELIKELSYLHLHSKVLRMFKCWYLLFRITLLILVIFYFI